MRSFLATTSVNYFDAGDAAPVAEAMKNVRMLMVTVARGSPSDLTTDSVPVKM